VSTAPFRRIVTGHNASGKAVILEDAPPPRVKQIGGAHGPMFYEVWNTRETPVRLTAVAGEPHEESIMLAPPKNGTRIRVLDIPPDDAHGHAEVGAAEASQHGAGSRHSHMHRTETIDYGIVLEGEITLLVDEGETVVRTGDIVIQRGTNHGWANRSGRNCRIAFILIDGVFDPELQR